MPFSREREETDKVTHAANAWWNVLLEPKERHKGKAPYKCSLRCGKNGLPSERMQPGTVTGFWMDRNVT